MADLYCDICGKQPVKGQILLEGAKLLACGLCARGGKMLYIFEEGEERGSSIEKAFHSKPVFDKGEEISENWGRLIRNAREKVRLPLTVIAERINEKESYLQGIENERIMPSIEVARKLEKELNIKIIERSGDSVAATNAVMGKFSEPTLGDSLIFEKKKKQ